MHPDEESHLRAAFAELHRQHRAQAPDFESMRRTALEAADAGKTSPAPMGGSPWLRWTACGAAACGLIAIVLWQLGPIKPPVQSAQPPATATRLGDLIDRIEQHVEFHSATALPEYPSDLLLSSLALESSL